MIFEFYDGASAEESDLFFSLDALFLEGGGRKRKRAAHGIGRTRNQDHTIVDPQKILFFGSSR